MDFLFGTKMEVVGGPALGMELGDEVLKLKRHFKDCPTIWAASKILGAVSTAWLLAHSLSPEDSLRAVFGALAQVTSVVLLKRIVKQGKVF